MSRLRFVTGGALAVAIASAGFAPAATATPAANLVFSIDARLATSVDPSDPTFLLDVSGNGASATASADDVRYNAKQKSLVIGNRSSMNNGFAVSAERFNFHEGITIEARVNFGKTIERWERIIDFGVGIASDNILFTRWGESNELMFEVWQGTDRVGRIVTTTAPLSARPRMHTYTATLTADGVPAIYVDGVEQAGEISWSPFPDEFGGLPLTVNRDSSYIGHSNWPDDDDARLSIQYLRIYDVALDAETVLGHATTNSKWDSVPYTRVLPPV